MNRQDQDAVITNRRMLKNIGAQHGYKIFVKEDLRANSRNIFCTTRKLLVDGHIEGIWTSFQKIKEKNLSGDVIVINSIADLRAL